MSTWETPLLVLAFFGWLLAPPASLVDVSHREVLRRHLAGRSVQTLTNDDVAAMPRRPLPTVADRPQDVTSAAPTLAGPDAAASKGDTAKHDEAWWRGRVAAARDALDHDQVFAEALQSRVNALTADWSARDDPAQREDLYQQRVRNLKELDAMREQVAKDVRAVADIEEEARRANIPSGWLR